MKVGTNGGAARTYSPPAHPLVHIQRSARPSFRFAAPVPAAHHGGGFQFNPNVRLDTSQVLDARPRFDTTIQPRAINSGEHWREWVRQYGSTQAGQQHLANWQMQQWAKQNGLPGDTQFPALNLLGGPNGLMQLLLARQRGWF